MQAPDFSLPDATKQIHSLADYAGKWLVLYFYPKDDTPGCTTEACGFRDAFAEYAKRSVSILGISKDTTGSHQRFAQKFELNFPLLSDKSTETIQAYGAWGQKRFMGRDFMGIIRTTFLINPAGEIVKTYVGMDTAVHASEILADIDKLQAS